ncbi:TetR/AcrR family transcriptional regulator [Pseudonocardia endophytica]|uniref:TetR family transcriptional regulator n=1 Tax=Pseudonocardia endophytica TaxID=401976 RepID=A0A4R1HY91_PSEEN|nr:TetR/AcrR family transcriptional regulator [Pseudonocardia endophytica]TCK25830.1 TetR family transcriptional regulator [Pseudonocardia endophytica]
MDEARPTLRADARRNREQIIEAARALFARVGPAVPMEEVARAAGVGVATLYRRFPDREQLIEAVSHDNVDRLVDLARRVERDEPDPMAALTTLLRSALDLRLGLVLSTVSTRTYRAVLESPIVAGQRAEVISVLRRLVHRAQADGSVRPDVDVGDAILALVLASQVVPPADDENGTMVFERLFALVMDGLRGTGAAPLPGHPLDYEQIVELGRRGTFGRTITPPQSAPAG